MAGRTLEVSAPGPWRAEPGRAGTRCFVRGARRSRDSGAPRRGSPAARRHESLGSPRPWGSSGWLADPSETLSHWLAAWRSHSSSDASTISTRSAAERNTAERPTDEVPGCKEARGTRKPVPTLGTLTRRHRNGDILGLRSHALRRRPPACQTHALHPAR